MPAVGDAAPAPLGSADGAGNRHTLANSRVSQGVGHPVGGGGRAPIGALIPALLMGVVAGAALQLQQPALWHTEVYTGLLFASVMLGWGAIRLARAPSAPGRRGQRGPWTAVQHHNALTLVVLTALTSALAVGAVTGLRATAYVAHALAPVLEGQDVRITATIAAMPQTTEAGTRLRMKVHTATLGGLTVALPKRVDVSWYAGSFRDADTLGGSAELVRQPPALQAGDVWSMTVRLKAPHGLHNPHGFDYELWMWEQGVQATGYVRDGPRDLAPQRLRSSWAHPVERLRQHVRDAIVRRLAGTSTEGDLSASARVAGVVAALVTGDQRAIDRSDWDVFRATGVSHLMSISGLHITLFAWLASLAVGALWRRSVRLCLWVPAPSAAMASGVVLAAGYALFSGWGVPAQRTVLMLSTLAVLALSGRRWPWPLVWLLAASTVVVVDPWALSQAGFWLSFVAVGVLFATNPIAKGPYGESVRGRFHSIFREQWVVTLALTPLTLLLFGQVSVVGFVANLFAIPWVTLVVTPLALAGMLAPPLWNLAALALQPLMAALQWLAQWPWAVWYAPAAPLWAGVAAVVGGVLLAMRMPWRLRWLALPLVLPVLTWQPLRPAHGQFELLAADIGQGNAVLVRTASHTLLYDAGPRFSRESDAGHRVLVPLLRATGERVDTLMLSHRDADHTGGAAAVLAQQPQAALTGSIEADHALQTLRAATPCVSGQHWVWDGVRFEVLHPLPRPPPAQPLFDADARGTASSSLQVHGQGGGDAQGVVASGPTVPANAPDATTANRPERSPRPNTLSCVLRVAAEEAAGAVALLAGDIESPQEQALVALGVPLRADVLLVPHHGSKTSSSPAFLDAVQPRVALVQAGYRNRFGHPANEVVQRYRTRQVEVVESARCGAATWSSARPDTVQCERQARSRVWHHQLPPKAE